ncbi:hypothetical protein [Paracandidimonas lactea]|uniref:hypothetical protein n=1 Tax=Paracandidimonas lactea TaxID=2895524 RepID=UPI001F3239E3|nr:hypothetical protein [Paracandidimonas lactea]
MSTPELPPLPEPCYRDKSALPVWNEPRVTTYAAQCYDAGFQAGYQAGKRDAQAE